ncbi:hypothetical protein C1752_01722 [Acaryochloris thomasi RCC1774]|uniref:Uncharacterized protein n=1 Tax=Acaryochloris thomasi RCC1774 TaxID=1764569 RepID=A0A2W1JK57_9CYAN|nr:DUF6208 family protein [Acaryochloris thomasi]PZD73813.1 hypothetical protein C1752_01722 [Acaryochloris thomasi RCC1774]
MSNTRRPLPLSLLWELPLAVLSFCFFKVVKTLIGLFYGIYLSRDRNRATQWQVLSTDVLSIPIVLPVLMTKGPRWNTHAIIGTVGPFAAQEAISIDLTPPRQSAQSWTIVVYRYPDYATVAQLSSLEQGAELQHTLKVAPGKYSLALRYYECSGAVEFPSVQADAVTVAPGADDQTPADTENPSSSEPPTINAQTASAETNAFYRHLSDRHNGFYLALHYYIYTLLQLRPWLPEAFVTREYLPVGNPDTAFFYDYVEAQQALSLSLHPTALQNYDIYFTLYSRSSLPLFYTKIEQETVTVPPFPTKGYYLIRTRPRNVQVPPPDSQLIQVAFTA